MAGETLKFLVEVDSATGEANLKRFSGALEDTGKKAQTASQVTAASVQRLQGQLTAFSSSAMQLGRSLTFAVTAPIAAVGFLGIRFNAMQEQARIAFTSMIGSASMARVKLEELKDFAARTPFQFPDLVRATQRLMAYGFAAREVIPVLTAVGDASAALGGSAETIDRITLAIGQIRAKGTLQSQEMRQLAEAGIPAWEILAKKLGVSIPEAMDKTEKRAVSASVAITALMEGINQRFGGMMEKQAHTFNGLVSTIVDESRFLAGALTEGLFNSIKGPTEKATDALHTFRVEIERLPDSVKSVIAISAGLVALAGPAIFLTGALAGSIGNIIKLGTVIAGWAGVTTISAGLLLAAEAIAAIGAAIAGIMIAKHLVDILQLNDALKGMGQEIVKLGKNAAPGLKLLSDGFKDVVSEIRNLISLMPGLGKFGDIMTSAFSTAAKFQIAQVTTSIKGVNQFIEGSIPPTQPAGTNMPPEARKAFAANEAKMQLGVPIAIKTPGVAGGAPGLSDFEKQVAAIMKSVIKDRDEMNALTEAIDKLEKKGVSAAVIAEALNDKIAKQADEARMLGMELTATLQRYVYWQELSTKVEQSLARVNGGMIDGNENFEAHIQHVSKINELYDLFVMQLPPVVIGLNAEADAIDEANRSWDKHAERLERNATLAQQLANQQRLALATGLITPPEIPTVGIRPGLGATQSQERISNAATSMAGGAQTQIQQLTELPHVLANVLSNMDPSQLKAAYDVMGDDILKAAEAAKRYHLALTPQEKATLDAAEAAVKATNSQRQLADAMSHALGQSIADLSREIAKAALNATSFRQGIAGVGKSLAQGMLEAVLTGFFAPLQQKMQEIGKNLAKVLSGDDGKGGLLGGVTTKVSSFVESSTSKLLGKTLGHALGETAGAVAGPLVGAAIGAAVGWIASQFGQGRRAANEFVQSTQNPFSENLVNTANSFYTAAAAGQITKSGGMAAREQVTNAWEQFQVAAANYAQKGAVEAKVAMQALATMAPIVAATLDSMDGAIAQLGSTARKTASQFEQAVESIVNSTTAYADNADVMEEALRRLVEKGVPASVILEANAAAIEATVNQLRALGMEIPETIGMLFEAASKGLSDFEKSVKDIVAGTTAWATNAPVLEEALKRLVAAGTPVSLILDANANAIEQTVAQLRTLGIEIPATIESIFSKINHSLEQFEKSVQDIVDSTTKWADSAPILEEALKRLIAKGVPTKVILDTNASAIESTAKQMAALGMAIPPNIAALAALINKETAAKKSLSAVDMVQMRISAYNAGFEVGQLVHSPNASRYNFTGVPKMPAFTEKTVVATNAQPTQNTAQVTIGTIQEGNIYITQTPDKSDSDVIAELKDALAHNRSNLKTDFQRAMKETQNAPTPPGVM